MSELPIAVVGSGPAGMAAAYRLNKQGFEVCLLEAAATIGGKWQSVQRDGFLLDTGAFFLPSTHKRMLKLAEDSGIASSLTISHPVISVHRDSRIHDINVNHVVGDFLKTGLFSTRTKLTLWPVVSALIQSSKASFDRIPSLGELDTQTALEWGEQTLTPELTTYIADMLVRAMSGASPNAASRVEILGLLALIKGANLLACPGGLGHFASVVGKDIPSHVNARVSRIQQQHDRVLIDWDENGHPRQSEFSACVVATSADVASNIVHPLDDWRKAYLQRIPDAKTLIVSFALSRPLEGINATYIMIPKTSHEFICGICSDHLKAPFRVPEGKGLMTIMPLVTWTESVFDQSDEEIAAQILDGLETLIPGVSSLVEFFHLTRWTQCYTSVGHYRDLEEFRHKCEQQDQRIQLAGDYHGYPQMDTAVRSGEEAVNRLLRAIGGNA